MNSSSLPVSKIRSRHKNHTESVWNKRAQKQEERLQKRDHLEKSIETIFKISVNLGISALALLSVKQLLPYYTIQQDKLAEIDQEISKIKPRVEKLEENFGTAFDPLSTPKVMQKNSHKVDPNVTPVFFLPHKK